MTLTILEASAEVGPQYIPWYAFQGYVRDNNGNGIPDATVEAGTQVATTDTSGYYYVGFNDPYIGPIDASKVGYFTEKKNSSTTRRPTEVDFQLTDDPETWVTMVALFPNTPLAYMEHVSTSSHRITVKQYAAGSGFTQTYDQTVQTGINAPGFPMALRRKAKASGIYDGSGTLLNLFVKEFTDVYVPFDENEYLHSDSVPAENWSVLRTQSIWQTRTLTGSTTLQAGLQTNVGFSILGFSASVPLETSVAVTSIDGDSVYWKITGNSTDYLYNFKVYMEDNIIPHIWYIGKDYVGPPPGGGGGCPYIYTWNGTQYAIDNNILPTSELFNGTDVSDYYKLEQTAYPKDGKYSLLLSEFEHEHSYIDQVKLIAVDHGSNVNIALGPNNEILTYKNPAAPSSAIDNYGNNRLGEISYMDGDISNPSTYFNGITNDYLTLDFGMVNSNNAKLILRDDQKCDFCCIDVQILNSDGEWQKVATVAPRSYWAVQGVDLSAYVIQNQDFKVRLVWTSPHKLDYVGLDTSRPAEYEISYASLSSAVHTMQGDVKLQLLSSDHIYAELIPNQMLKLEFTLPNNHGQERTLILYTEGRYYHTP